MLVQNYLMFDGRCDEALAFYRKALGAEVQMRMTFADNPDKGKSEMCMKVP
ncbi:MAG: VOC family protein, partial [Alphaproteobacteria bacterium]|nr:VOC family protein [Alphaproteobacteria bacterium]